MIKESFNPVYNNIEQVKNCASHMLLGEAVVEARVAIVIGHNGRDFVSSTDWRLTTQSGTKRILPFSIRPQYPNFLECVAGVRYWGQNALFSVCPDADDNRHEAIVEICGKQYHYGFGEALKIYVNPGENFIATDCAVVCEELEKVRIYRVITNDNTLYGNLDENGRISQI